KIEDLTHLAAHTPHFINGWSSDQRFEVLKLMADIRNQAGSPSHARYIDNVARRYVSQLTASERVVALDQGEKWPGAAMGAIAKLPVVLDFQTLEKLMVLDEALVGRDDDPASHLRIGITAVLARSGKEHALAYLRDLYENEPERRGILAVGLAQHPEGENWPLLIRSLTVLEGGMAVDVLTRLIGAQQVEDDPEAIRQVILQGLSQNQNIGRSRAIQLLEKWTGTYVGDSDESTQNTLVAWQDWFEEQYPHLPLAELPKKGEDDRYSISELQKYLTSDEATAANAAHGRLVYSQAQCIKCHRYGNVGESIGPDLTTISKRFQKKELLQSIVFPSHIISDQYATKTVATTDGRIHTGIVKVNNDGSVEVIDTEGKQLEVAADDIEEIIPSNQSSMPPGLLNSLTLQEIADLFAFLNQPPPTNLSRRPER
ncbi:MAG: c-type cytochrome, partial [Planctomycetales bacterium]